MPIPSIDGPIDIPCSEMLSSSIALTCLYRWNRYRAFGTDIVRNLAEASLAFIFAVFRFASPAHCIASVAREMLIILRICVTAVTRYYKILKASAEERALNISSV